MTLSRELPAQCQQCAKAVASTIHHECAFCPDIGFHEEVLCHLNRSTQDTDYFECYAFKPALRVVRKPEIKVNDLCGRRKEVLKTESVRRFLSTDTIKKSLTEKPHWWILVVAS